MLTDKTPVGEYPSTPCCSIVGRLGYAKSAHCRKQEKHSALGANAVNSFTNLPTPNLRGRRWRVFLRAAPSSGCRRSHIEDWKDLGMDLSKASTPGKRFLHAPSAALTALALTLGASAGSSLVTASPASASTFTGGIRDTSGAVEKDAQKASDLPAGSCVVEENRLFSIGGVLGLWLGPGRRRPAGVRASPPRRRPAGLLRCPLLLQ